MAREILRSVLKPLRQRASFVAWEWHFRRKYLGHKPRTVDTSWPYLTGQTFRSLCDFVVDDQGPLEFLPCDVFDGASIFVKPDPEFMGEFATRIRPRLRCRYKMVTHNGANSVTSSYKSLLDDERLVCWFALNATEKHPKVHSLPLGLANARWPHGDVRAVEAVLHDPPARTGVMYANFDPATNTTARGAASATLKRLDFVTVAERKPFPKYLRELAAHRFTLSPEGRGIDCHRTWEAMLVGTIPIVQHSVHMDAFADFPLVLVHDWLEVTPSFLEEQYRRIQEMDFDRKKLFMPYWESVIRNA